MCRRQSNHPGADRLSLVAMHGRLQRNTLWSRRTLGVWPAVTNLEFSRAMSAAHDKRSLGNRHRAAADPKSAARCGQVDLIGCGPGDPELLTLKALRSIEAADVVVTDRLVAPEIVALARADARKISVGKTPYQPSTGQDEINRILVREAMKCAHVARLKGGDPGIFGRLAEEVSALRAADIPIRIIPGITAAHACAADIGLPVTLRGAVRQFSVVTGATADEIGDLDWHGLAQDGQAFAIYMGVRSAAMFASRLINAGAPAHRSVIVVENGTRPAQQVVHTELGLLDAALKHYEITGPAIIFVGLDWTQANLSAPAGVLKFAGPRQLATDDCDDAAPAPHACELNTPTGSVSS